MKNKEEIFNKAGEIMDLITEEEMDSNSYVMLDLDDYEDQRRKVEKYDAGVKRRINFLGMCLAFAAIFAGKEGVKKYRERKWNKSTEQFFGESDEEEVVEEE